jgi:hypothetical protein
MHMSDGDMLENERVGRDVGLSSTIAFDWYLVSFRASIGAAQPVITKDANTGNNTGKCKRP